MMMMICSPDHLTDNLLPSAVDPKRNKPAKGCDSMCVPGRRLPLSGGGVKGAMMEEIVSGNSMEEYVVFHPAQVLPMYLICYDTISHD